MRDNARTSPYEDRVREVGREIFDYAHAAEPRFWQQDFWVDRVTGFTMQDENLKVRAFRWVDALPAMRSDVEIAEHLMEYLDPKAVRLPGPAKLALSFTNPRSFYARTLGSTARRVAYAAAGKFICGSNPAEAIAAVERKRRQNMAFTLDVLGEATISGRRADAYARAYVDLIEQLAPAAAAWKEISLIDRDSAGPMPRVNVSVKLTCLDTHFDAIDPVRARRNVNARLRPILRAAQKHGAFVNIDMESFAVRDLTLELFKTLLMEPEFRDWPDVGIVVQAYLKDAEQDLQGLLDWVDKRGTPVAVRLVKGAYWDHETILAEQNSTPIPVWERKWESDVCYEKLTRTMLENHHRIRPAFASHNVRSLAHAIACARHLGLSVQDYEIQMLHGMGDPLKKAILRMGQCLRIYCPYGDMITGMAYLVRRLLENTSNDSFLRQGFSERRSQEQLLTDPNLTRPASTTPPMRHYQDTDEEEKAMHSFRNAPATSFGNEENRRRMVAAIKQLRSEFGRNYPLVIDGVNINTEETIPSVNPAKPGEVVGNVAQATVKHVNDAVQVAREAFENWRQMPAPRRAQILNRAADRMQEKRIELAASMVLEAGKPWREADADVGEGIDYIRYYAQRIEHLDRQPRRRDLPGEENVLLYEPCGVCAVISPFNFPIAIVANQIGAALAVGNTVVFKPASSVAVTGARFMDVLEYAGVPSGVVNYVPGAGSVVGDHLAQHPNVAVVAFTGTQTVGLPLMESAAVTRPHQRLIKRVVTDMGGKNATIVDADAELDEAVMGVLASAFAYAGQRCSACGRAIVLDGIYDDFCAKLVEATESLVVGSPEEPGTEVGPVIDQRAVQYLRGVIEQGKKEARVVFEADVSGAGDGWYVGPTVIADVPHGSSLAREEIFGPVLVVIRAGDFAEALAVANDSPYALTGGVYSRSPANLETARREFRVGNLYINRKITGSRVDVQPFGGFRLSGTGCGKSGGPDYLVQFCYARNITENALRHGFAPVDAEEHATSI